MDGMASLLFLGMVVVSCVYIVVVSCVWGRRRCSSTKILALVFMTFAAIHHAHISMYGGSCRA